MTTFPLPPPEIAEKATSTTGQTIMTVAVAIGVVAVSVLAVRLSLRHRTGVPVAVAIGALLSAFVEPLPDATANLWYYAVDQKTIYTSFENPFPIWTWFTYLVFYGGGGLGFWVLVERGADRRRIYLACIPLALYLAGAELFMINVMEVYTYYGHAAFVVGHFPLWIPVLNTSIIVMIGVGSARIRRSLPTRDQLLPALLLPGGAMTLGLLFAPAAVQTVTHTEDPSTALVYGATLVAVAMALGLIRVATLLMPSEGFTPMAAAEPERAEVP